MYWSIKYTNINRIGEILADKLSFVPDETLSMELWSLLEADSPTQYKITIVQISKESVMWVAGGHMYTNGDGIIYQSKEGDHSEEES